MCPQWNRRKITKGHGRESVHLRSERRLQTHDDWKAGRAFTNVSLTFNCTYNQILTIIFQQNSPEEEAELKKLKDIEKTVEQTAKKLEKVDGELTGLKNVSNQLWPCKGFLLCPASIKSWITAHFFHRAFWPKISRRRRWGNWTTEWK